MQKINLAQKSLQPSAALGLTGTDMIRLQNPKTRCGAGKPPNFFGMICGAGRVCCSGR